MISRFPGSLARGMSQKPVTPVNAVASQVREPMRVVGFPVRLSNWPPKTGYTPSAACCHADAGSPDLRPPDLRFCSGVSAITAVTGFWDIGAPRAIGRAKTQTTWCPQPPRCPRGDIA